jgi:ADP-ribosylglycohydrolase
VTDTRSTRERYRGCLLGLATGDALGTTLEFQPRGSFQPIDEMVGGGPFGLEAGQWTDDTSMALCLAESIVEEGWDPADQMRRYLRWYREGHLSSTGAFFDIGITTSEALSRFEESGEAFSGRTGERTAGNGSIMRLAPVAMRYARDPELARARSAESSRTTHGAPVAVDACRMLGAMLVDALQGVPVEALLAPGRYDAETDEIKRLAHTDHASRIPAELSASGYVVDTLEAALWALATTEDFRSGSLRAVNLGNDADTTGAVYGQLAGAVYGAAGIPQEWRARLALRETITTFADALYDLVAS